MPSKYFWAPVLPKNFARKESTRNLGPKTSLCRKEISDFKPFCTFFETIYMSIYGHNDGRSDLREYLTRGRAAYTPIISFKTVMGMTENIFISLFHTIHSVRKSHTVSLYTVSCKKSEYSCTRKVTENASTKK